MDVVRVLRKRRFRENPKKVTNLLLLSNPELSLMLHLKFSTQEVLLTSLTYPFPSRSTKVTSNKKLIDFREDNVSQPIMSSSEMSKRVNFFDEVCQVHMSTTPPRRQGQKFRKLTEQNIKFRQWKVNPVLMIFTCIVWTFMWCGLQNFLSTSLHGAEINFLHIYSV